MDKSGTKLSRVECIGHEWDGVVRSETEWTRVAQRCQEWIVLGISGMELSGVRRSGQEWHNVVKSGLYWA